ncbi:MAG: DUF1521 domain-containing protein [Leptolinea sp.]
MIIGSDSLQSLVLARRLLLLTRQIEQRRNNPQLEGKSFKEMMEEDEILLSGGEKPQAVQSKQTTASAVPDNLDIKLSDLAKRLDEVRNQPPTGGKTTEKAAVTQSYSSSLSVELTVYAPVDGLVVRNQHLSETNTYAFEFIDGSTFKITDKATGKSTTIWGDPHVDTSDEEGDRNGEFSDLKTSDKFTTFQLRDGTRLTFTAKDSGIIEAVDIFKDNQFVHGIGAAATSFKPETGLFDTKLRTTSASSSRPEMGDVVYAGGDGNDWFDAAHRMVWGKTTGPMAGIVPAAILQVRYTEQFMQQTTLERINQAA